MSHAPWLAHDGALQVGVRLVEEVFVSTGTQERANVALEEGERVLMAMLAGRNASISKQHVRRGGRKGEVRWDAGRQPGLGYWSDNVGKSPRASCLSLVLLECHCPGCPGASP